MNCRQWEELLDDLLAGRLPVEQRRRAREHMDGCADCAGLFAVARLNKAALGDETDSELTAAILARTSGSACERAAELISLPAEDLAAGDRTLLDLHRETCDDCEALARSMAWVTETLPGMAELEPDAAFTADVLAACVEPERLNPFTALLENVDREVNRELVGRFERIAGGPSGELAAVRRMLMKSFSNTLLHLAGMVQNDTDG